MYIEIDFLFKSQAIVMPSDRGKITNYVGFFWGEMRKRGSITWKTYWITCEISLQAIEGTYIDKKCPFTGNVSIRGRILTGIVASMKMKRTIVIRRDYLHHIKKYNRFEKRHKNLSAHLSPCFRFVKCLFA